MTTPSLNKPMPDFSLPATNGKTVTLADFKGKNIVLYFYPRDNTPGCTQESIDFKDHYQHFANHNTVILGVSRDTLKSHEKFKDKYQFPFELLADDSEAVCQQYGVMKNKTMFGKFVKGIERSTFVIDSHGVLRREWRKVKVDGHVAEVLAAIKELS
jgi:thioredoxin-dependent peroxiredoxin